MEQTADPRYKLAPGTQVREEDFGLLFYTMAGPRLYFLTSGEILESDFFRGELTLEQWIAKHAHQHSFPEARISALKKRLNQLKEKGVVLAY